MGIDLNNAVGNAVNSLFKGSDHTARGAINSLVNDNIYEQFLYRLLFSSNSIPLQSQWFMLINELPKPGSSNHLIKELNRYTVEDWEIEDGYKEGISDEFHNKSNGCIFAQAVVLPGDGITVTRQGSENTGYLRGLTGSGRKNFEELTTSFLDTNTSFTDFVLRPWVALVGYKSLKDQTLKSTITIFNLKKTGAGNPLRPRKTTTFHNCVPTSIDSEEYNYLGDKIIQRKVTWSYDYYIVKTESRTNQDIILNFLSNITGIRGLDDPKAVLKRGIEGLKAQGKNTFEEFIDNALSGIASNIGGAIFGSAAGGASVSNIDTAVANSIAELSISQNDTPRHDIIPEKVNSLKSSLKAKSSESNKEVEINDDDTPDTFSLANVGNILPPSDDTSTLSSPSPGKGDQGQLSLSEVVEDTISGIKGTPKQFTPNPINKSTTKAVGGLQKSTAGIDLPLENVPKIKKTGNQDLSINKDDNISGKNSLSKFGKDVKIDKNDTSSNSIPVKIITIDKNDTP